MISTQIKEQAAHIKFLVNQGRDPASKEYFHPEIGFNYRMTNLEAALGLAQLERLPEFLAKKRRFYEIYREMFAGTNVLIQSVESDSVTSAWLSSVIIDTKKAGLTIPEIQARLKDQGIPTRRVFPPMVDFPPYQKYKTREYIHSQKVYTDGLNLPSSTLNREEDIRYVAEVLLGIVKG